MSYYPAAVPGRRLLGALALVVAAACQMEVAVGVDVADDGSGRVQVGVALDAEAAGHAPELAGQLEVDDLVGAGWAVTGPTLEEDGRTWLRASRPFATLAEGESVLDQVDGPDGPFRDFRLERSRSFLAETWRLSGTVDLTAGLAGFSDDALRERLDGASFGATDVELERRAGQPLDQAVRFRVEAGLPGTIRSNGQVDTDGQAVWLPAPGQEAALAAQGRVLDRRRLISLSVAGMAGVLLVGLLTRRLVRRLR